ncbi:ABC transporter ATP-binding protein/permease, partial [bacterium]|nr:ABC transporter ATP-binding protein/permease [bacterium]
FSGFASIYFLVIKISKRYVKENSEIISVESTKVIKILQEALGGIRDVLVDGLQTEYIKEYKKSDYPFRQAHANLIILGDSPRYIIEALGMILISILAFHLSNKGDTLVSAIPVLGAFALGAQRLLPLIQQAYSSWTNINGAGDNLNDTLELLKQKVNSVNDGSEKIVLLKTLTLESVFFRYNRTDDSLILNDIDLSISKGEMIGVIGTSGSGKSTMVDLIMGLLYPVQGKLLVDGREINALNYHSWVPNISHVPQSIFLADTTIAGNIALGVEKDRINYQKVEIAIEKAQLTEFVNSLELGYHTNVGERGVKLSGGQKQRIGIARAIYKESNLIIFDEATSALDTQTEINVMRAIDLLKRDITVIIIAHRYSTLRNCDRIVHLEKGRIKGIHSYQELMSE